jgi:hypothetical protein
MLFLLLHDSLPDTVDLHTSLPAPSSNCSTYYFLLHTIKADSTDTLTLRDGQVGP